MKVVDTNVLLYAVNPAVEQHRVARSWLDRMLAGGAPIGFAWTVLIGFVRIATLPAAFDRPMTTDEALDRVDLWLGARSAQVLSPGSQHATILRTLLTAVGHGGNIANDAHLAALAIENKANVVSFDSDFGRFPGVRWERPR